jgi:hypothetical protein
MMAPTVSQRCWPTCSAGGPEALAPNHKRNIVIVDLIAIEVPEMWLTRANSLNAVGSSSGGSSRSLGGVLMAPAAALVLSGHVRP